MQAEGGITPASLRSTNPFPIGLPEDLGAASLTTRKPTRGLPTRMRSLTVGLSLRTLEVPTWAISGKNDPAVSVCRLGWFFSPCDLTALTCAFQRLA